MYFLIFKITPYDQKQPLTNIGFSRSIVNISNIVFGRRLCLIDQSHANVPFRYPMKIKKTRVFLMFSRGTEMKH